MTDAVPERTDPAPPPACLNCGAAFGAPRPRFCPDCGQESNVKPPRLGEFLQQFGGAYFSTEGALWRTLKLLLFKPGELTRQYLAGRRKHYVLPLRLYLTISLVTLLLLRMVATVTMSVPDLTAVRGPAGAASAPVAAPSPGPDAGVAQSLVIKLGRGEAGLKNGHFFCENLPDWLCKRFQRRIDLDPQSLNREIRQGGERFVGNLGAAMFVLLPSFALWLKLVYWNRHMRYTEHLVFALHTHAFWFLALAVAMSEVSWLVMAALMAVPVHTLLAMGRVYGGRRWPRLLRALLVSLLYGVVLALSMIGLGLWTLLA